MRYLTFLTALLVAAGCGSAGPIMPDPASCNFARANEQVKLGGGDLTLINGRPAKPEDWPASVYPSAGNSRCSSTIIGDRVLISAGHCMGNGSTVRFSVGPNQYTARCTHHPEYRGNSTADWALCLIDKPVVGIKYDKIIAGTVPVKVGDKVLASGYGCTQPGGGGGNDGIFRIGETTVTQLPSGRSYDIVTRSGGALCFGDSGGALWLIKENGDRFQIGVNSRGDIATTSYLSALGVKTFETFILDWAKANGVKVCGVHPDAQNCRMTEPPGPSPRFIVNTEAACVEGKVYPPYMPKKDSVVSTVRKALESIR